MKQGTDWERYALLLPIGVVAAIGGVVSSRDSLTPANVLPWIWLLLLLASPATFKATKDVFRSRNEPTWSAIRWLPLRGKWLCYFVTTLLAIPGVMVPLVTGVGLWQFLMQLFL